MAATSVSQGRNFKVTSDGTVAMGDWSLYSQATTGLTNTGIGYLAGYYITTGDKNTIIGYNAHVDATTGGATVIGAEADLMVANATTTSLALGYAAHSTNNNVCVIGDSADQVTVVEYGPHFGFHPYPYRWLGENYGGSNFTITASEMLAGLVSMFGIGTLLVTNYNCTTATAAQVVAAIPDCVVGSAFYLKVGVYESFKSTAKLRLTFGAGWTLMGITGVQIIPRLSRTTGCKVFLCVVTALSPAAITVLCPNGPAT